MARRLVYEFNPFKQTGQKAPTKGKPALMADIARFVESEILQSVASEESPVEGEGSFSPLSKEYAKIKKKQGKGGKANLKLNFDMLPKLKVTVPSPDKIRISISGKQGDKAQGHCQIGEAGPKGVPKRRFIPARQQRLRSDIMDGVELLIDSVTDGED